MFRLRQRHHHYFILYQWGTQKKLKKYSIQNFLKMRSAVVQQNIKCTSIINILVDSTPDTVQRQQASTVNVP